MTRAINLFFLFFIILSSCHDNNNSDKPKTGPPKYDEPVQDTIRVNIHKDLLWTNAKVVGDLGAENYSQLEKLSEKTFTNLQYYDDLILVTCYFETSGCGGNVGNIEIKNDSLFLLLPATTNILCTELDYYKVTYLISNPTKKHFKISK